MLSRADSPAPIGPPGPADDTRSPSRHRRWTSVLTWIVLGAAIAALWALLLLGDSLRS